MITYATACSGIEAMSVAVRPFKWKPVFFLRDRAVRLGGSRASLPVCPQPR